MAKMKRSTLKSIVKECLIEILAEGLSDSPGALREAVGEHRPDQRSSRMHTARQEHNPQQQRRTTALDTPVIPNPNFEENVQNAVASLSSDPIMQEILRDTARGSLQRVSQSDSALGSVTLSEGSQRPNPTAGPQLQGDPVDIFEQISPGSSSKWADLAFAAPARPSVPQAN